MPATDPRYRRRAIWVSLIALTLTATAVATAAAPATRPAAPASSPSEVQAYKKMVVDLTAPAMEGRDAGSKGLDKARDYLIAEFKQASLRPAFGSEYTQGLTIPMGVKITKQALLLTNPEDEVLATGEPGKNFTALGNSGQGTFSGPGVFIGYGINDAGRQYNSFEGLEEDGLRGKVAVAFRYEPQDESGRSLWTRRNGRWTAASDLTRKAAWAAKHGAIALVVVNPLAQSDARLLPPTRRGRNRSSIPVMHASLDWMMKMLAAAGHNADQTLARLQQEADKGTGRPELLKNVSLRGQVKWINATARIHNVGGIVPGAGDLAKEFVVVGGHYDHVGYGAIGSRSREHKIHPGADDNASGTAGVVILARRLAKRAATSTAPRRTVVLVCFAGEERGLWGSRYLANHLDDAGIEPKQLVAMINMDMIGRLRGNRLAMYGLDTGDRWRAIVAEAEKGSKLVVRKSGSGMAPSDQISFLRRKVPVLMVNTGMHRELHTPKDTAELINAEGAVRIVHLVERILTRVAAERKRIEYKTPKAGSRDARLADGSPILGVHLDPRPTAVDGTAGCLVTEVLPHGPAATAGMETGDVIVKWNGTPTPSRTVVQRLIRQSKPGQKATVTVIRNGREVKLTVTLGKR